MPSDPRDYKLDLSTGAAPSGGSGGGAPGRPFLSVHFACCGVYTRIYRDPNDPEYRGRCPRCGKPVRFVVGDGGTSSRTFVVT
jgi:hypothetical protein